jgi:flagellar basal body rod protein FlgG
MIYGLYLSATGVLTNSYRQDVIANNLANAETVGFKRSLALFRERRTEAQQMGQTTSTNKLLEPIGGGTLLAPTYVDHSQGHLEDTNNTLDAAILGRGYFAVQTGSGPDGMRLTRNGQFMTDRAGNLILSDGSGHKVLDFQGKTINLGNIPADRLSIRPDGTICANEQPVAKLALLDVPDETLLRSQGSTLLSYPGNISALPTARDATVQNKFIEGSNVDPMSELTQLINAQRQLEANANMIRYQDQSLGKLVNEVGKIG